MLIFQNNEPCLLPQAAIQETVQLGRFSVAIKEAINIPSYPTRMPCMEICGGNGEVDKRFTMPGLDTWVCSKPQGSSAVDGGEIHFISSCASGRITRMLLADICAPGAVFIDLSSQLRDMMMHNANSITQTRFIRGMHDRLLRFADIGGYAGAQIGTYFAPTQSFTLCNAGYPTPLVYRAAFKSWSALKAATAEIATSETSVPLGVLDESEYQQFSMRLEEGDMVLSYSNALIENRPTNGRTLGLKGLLNTLNQLDSTEPEEIVTKLVSLLADTGSQQQGRADATFLLCRGTDRRVHWKDNLLAPFRLLGRVSDSTHLL